MKATLSFTDELARLIAWMAKALSFPNFRQTEAGFFDCQKCKKREELRVLPMHHLIDKISMMTANTIDK